MKRPSVSFSKDAILGFLLAHCEKIVVSLVALVALGLAWGGISAVRVKSVKPDQTPEALRDFTARVNRHIDAAPKPPADALPPLPKLAEAVEPWLPGQVAIAPPPANTAMLDKPLFQELAKRLKPEVFPIEDLRAEAGVAVLPDTTRVAMAPAMPQPELPVDEPRGRGRRRQPQPQPLIETMPAQPLMPAETLAPGRIQPYVLVTGLVPVARQRTEFERCFGSAGLQDPRRDQPHWGQYRVERAPDGSDDWKPLKLQNVETFQQGGMQGGMRQNPDDAPLQPELLPPVFLLGPNEADIGYVAGLPQRIDDAWSLAAVHPWFREELTKFLAERREGLLAEVEAKPLAAKELKTDAEDHLGDVVLLEEMKLTGELDPQPQSNLAAHGVQTADGEVTFELDDVGTAEGPVFVFSSQWARSLAFDGGVKIDTPCTIRARIEKIGETPVARILGILFEGDDEEIIDPVPLPLAGGTGMMAAGGGGDLMAAGGGADFRLFRFVDTDVKPGDRWRYRVRLAVGNPNFGLDKQHLADPAAAKGEYLLSKESAASPAVEVPDPTAVVVRTLSKDEIKKLKRPKPGWFEVLVLGEGADTGNFALRSVITEPGGVANVDPSLNKPGDTRMRGEAIVTDRILLDARGRQEEPGPGTAGDDPLELLFFDPASGRFEFVSAADSQAAIERYRSTLPAIEDGKKPSGKKDSAPAVGPTANPFETGRP